MLSVLQLELFIKPSKIAGTRAVGGFRILRRSAKCTRRPRAFGTPTGVANDDIICVFEKGTQCFREKIRGMKGEKNGESFISKRQTTQPNVTPGLQASRRGMERDVYFTPHTIEL